MIRTRMKIRAVFEVRDKDDGHYYLIRRGDWHEIPALMQPQKAADFALAFAEENLPNRIATNQHD